MIALLCEISIGLFMLLVVHYHSSTKLFRISTVSFDFSGCEHVVLIL